MKGRKVYFSVTVMKFTAQVVFHDHAPQESHDPVVPLLQSLLATLKERDPELLESILTGANRQVAV